MAGGGGVVVVGYNATLRKIYSEISFISICGNISIVSVRSISASSSFFDYKVTGFSQCMRLKL